MADVYNVIKPPFLFPSGAALGGGSGAVSPEMKDEDFEAGEFTGVDQAIFITTENFVGVPSVYRDGVYVPTAEYNVTGLNEITFLVDQPLGTAITIIYLAQV